MPRFSDMTNRWDQWVLMRCPLLWQLRLHWYLPLALLWCVLVLGIWMQWMAEPARWMGSLPGVASTAQQTPEQLALDIGSVVAWIVAIGLALWWLLRVRIHNRWREHAPVGRWGLWWEYLWGALFLSLLFAPAIAFSPIYEMRIQRQWSDTDVSAQIQTVEQVAALEALAAPRQAAMLVEWIRVLREEEVDPAKYPGIQALVWLMREDQAAIAATLERYGQPLQARGYVRQSASSAQDQAEHLLASYRSALQSPWPRNGAPTWQRTRNQRLARRYPERRTPTANHPWVAAGLWIWSRIRANASVPIWPRATVRGSCCWRGSTAGGARRSMCNGSTRATAWPCRPTRKAICGALTGPATTNGQGCPSCWRPPALASSSPWPWCWCA